MHEMPRAAKLVAALAYAALGYGAATLYQPLLGEAERWELFPPLAALLGALVGWRTVGRMLRRTGSRRDVTRASAGLWAGLFGAAWLVIWADILFALAEMLSRALERRYRGFGEGFDAWVQIGWYYLTLLADPLLLAVLVVGGAAAVLLTWAAARIWD